MTGAERIYQWLDRLRILQLWIAAAALLLMMFVTVIDVCLRYALNSPIRGSYDLVEMTLVMFVFYGLASAFLFRRHIVIDLIDLALPPRAVTVLMRIADLLSITVLVILAYAMITPAMQAYDYGDRKLELQLPIYVLWMIALSGMAGTILCAFGALIAPLPADAHEASQ